MDLTVLLERGFDFVLSLHVSTQLISPVMITDGIGSFWEIGFDMVKNMKFWDLVNRLSSLKQFDGGLPRLIYVRFY